MDIDEEGTLVERREQIVETCHNLGRMYQPPPSENIYDIVDGLSNRRERRVRLCATKKSKGKRATKKPDDPRKVAMPKHSGAAGYDRWIENEWGRYDADDEDGGVPMDGYHKSIIQGWTPLYSMDDVYGTEGRVREGEENPRCPAHSARRLAVALNLGPRELRTNPDAIQACTKEWIKLL